MCDDRLFAADGIVAAGDVARWNWRHDGGEEQIRIEHWQVAAEAGVAAARSLLAGRADAPSFTPVPYFWSDQYGIRFQVLGNPAATTRSQIVDGSLGEGKFVALFGRAGRLRAVMAIGRPRQLMGFRPLLEAGCSWDDALAHRPSAASTCQRSPRWRRHLQHVCRPVTRHRATRPTPDPEDRARLNERPLPPVRRTLLGLADGSPAVEQIAGKGVSGGEISF